MELAGKCGHFVLNSNYNVNSYAVIKGNKPLM